MVRKHSPHTPSPRLSWREEYRRSSRTLSLRVIRLILPAGQIALTRRRTSDSLLAAKLSRTGVHGRDFSARIGPSREDQNLGYLNLAP